MPKDGAFPAVDSSELAFRLATIGASCEIYRNAKSVILEPFMNIEVVEPGEFQSVLMETQISCFAGERNLTKPSFLQAKLLVGVIGELNTRRGTIGIAKSATTSLRRLLKLR